MASRVAHTLASGEHLLVQAGTGTGKSLGYLAPALANLVEHSEARIVIATATLALQAQLASKDIPAAVAACEQVTGQRVSHAVLKGRSNYACLLRVRDGQGVDQDALVPEPGGCRPGSVPRWSRCAAGRRPRRRRATSPTVTTRRRTLPRALGAGVGARCANVWGRSGARTALECLVEKSRETGTGQPAGGHQPRPAGRRRAARRHGAARVRRGDHRRGARTGVPGDRRRVHRTEPATGRASGPPVPDLAQ